MQRLICLLIGYAFGLLQTGYIIGKIKGIDIRKYGSKNAGSTNVLRTMGIRYALLTFAGDACKCILAVIVAYLLFHNSCSDYIKLLQLYAASGVVLGHNYPFYMNFKGGKGIASTCGLIISFGPIPVAVGFVTFFGTFFLTHYVSLGSILLYLSFFAESVIMGEMGLFHFAPEINRACLNEFYAVTFCLTILALWRHKENIIRLLKGEERKTYFKSKPEIEVDNNDNKKE